MALHLDIRRGWKQILMLLGLVVLANVAFFALATRPAVSAYQTLLRESPDADTLDERRQVVEEAEAYLDAVNRATSDLTTLRDDVLSTRSGRMVDVQLELARLAAEFKIDLDSVNYQNEFLEDEGLERFAMVVPLEGGYIALRRFLQAVEDSEEFIVVERVAIAQTKQGGALLQLNITLATYFNPPADELERRRRPARGRAAGSRNRRAAAPASRGGRR